MNDLPTPSDNVPTRPDKLRCDYDDSPSRIAIDYRYPKTGLVFFGIWLSIWTFGCVGILVKLIQQPDWYTLLFAAPFWAAWLLVTSIVIKLAFGRDYFELTHDGAHYRKSAIVTLATRTVPLAEIKHFQACHDHDNSDAGKDETPTTGIKLTTLGQPVEFLFDAPADEAEWIAHQLNSRLSELTHSSALNRTELDENETEHLTVEKTLGKPPSDTEWTRIDSGEAILFEHPKRRSRSKIGFLLFLNAFWNGIVGVFLLSLTGLAPHNPPQGNEWWFLFCFLIPFELVGFALIVVLMRELSAPLVPERWQFEARRITHAARGRMFRQATISEIGTLDRLELYRVCFGTEQDEGGIFVSDDYGLRLVDGDGHCVVAIEPLTEGEARWMAHVILTERPAWFAPST